MASGFQKLPAVLNDPGVLLKSESKAHETNMDVIKCLVSKRASQSPQRIEF